VASLEAERKTAVIVAEGDRARGVIGIADLLRGEAN